MLNITIKKSSRKDPRKLKRQSREAQETLKDSSGDDQTKLKRHTKEAQETIKETQKVVKESSIDDQMNSRNDQSKLKR